jgi:hypothetical protein
MLSLSPREGPGSKHRVGGWDVQGMDKGGVANCTYIASWNRNGAYTPTIQRIGGYHMCYILPNCKLDPVDGAQNISMLYISLGMSLR